MSTYTDEEIELLADSVRLTHSVFADIHDPLAREGGHRPFMILRVLCRGAAIRSALIQAREHGYLPKLLDRLNNAHAFDETASQGPENGVVVRLQAMLNKDIGFGIPNVVVGGGQTACRRVCRVQINGASVGTGFLVGPQAILTACHVVDSLVDPETGQALENSGRMLGFEFERAGLHYATERVQAAEAWLLAYSRAHPLEVAETPFDLDSTSDQDFDTCLDFALVRLERAVGRERGWYQLDENKRPCVSENGSRGITLFQHPGGASMRLAHGQTIRLWPPRHGTRLHHSANSVQASSGGLLLNSSYEMIGLHNATLECVAKASNDDSAQPEKINVAVPTATIAKGPEIRGKASIIEGLDPILRIPGTGAPVVGRDHFQHLVLQAQAGHKRILIVRGPKGTGKSFSAEILKAMLKTDSHKYVVLQAADLSAIPEKLAATVLQPLVVDETSIRLPSPTRAQTAADAWIRDVLYPAMMEQLRIAADGAMVWLVVDNLDINPLAQSSSMHLLDRVFLDIERYDFLRVVLIAPSAIPNAPPRAIDYDECAHLTEDDITKYVERRLVEAEKGAETPNAYVSAILHMANEEGVATVENVARMLREWFEKEMQKP